ncbi:hypothetical protein V8C86DRAFT_217136 [Haematococcus lacustris]
MACTGRKRCQPCDPSGTKCRDRTAYRGLTSCTPLSLRLCTLPMYQTPRHGASRPPYPAARLGCAMTMPPAPSGEWGNVAITLDMDSLVRDSSNRSILEQLADIELQYRLIGPNLGDTTLIAIYESTDAAMTSSSLCTKVAVLADQWELCVWVKDWRPAYLVPLLVVLVLVAFLLSTALAAVLLSRHEHKALLRSLLPEEAIQKMQANFDWAASANHGNKPQAMLESGTPAEMILGIMEDIVVGRPPALPKVMAVRHTLQQSLDVYKPLQADLSTRIAQTDNIDSEVHEALMVQLMGRKAKVEPDGDTQAFSEEGDATARPIKLHGNIRTSSGRHSRTAVHRAPLAPALARGHVDGASSPTASPNAPGRLGAPAYRTCVSAPQADLRAAVLLSEPGSGPADQHPDGATREGKEQQQEEEEEEGEGCHVPVPSCALKMQGAAPDLQLTPDLSPPASPGPCSTPGASGPGAGHAVGQLSSMLMRIMAQQQQEVQPPGSGLALLVAQVGQVSALLEAGQQSRRGRAAALHPEAGPLTPHPVPLPCTATLPATSSGGPGSSALGHEEAVLQTAHSQVVLALPSMPHSRQQPWGGGMDTMRSSIELPVQLPAMVQVESCLGSASTWAFDAFHLTSATAGRPLSVLAYWLLQQSGLAAWAHLDHTKLARWLCRVEDGYCANPYHNRSHAADVVQTMHMLLTRGGLMPGYADHLTQLAAYLAAVCHDYQHIGRTNDWLVETQDELALRYNDRSPMENHHLAGAFSLLKHPDLNFLQTMPKATYDRLRKLVIELVLGTDMKQHFSIMGSFTAMHRAAPAMLQSKRSAQALDRASHAVTPSELSMASCRPTGDGHCAKDAGKKLQPCSEQDKLLSLQMALKCSDLGHLAAPLPVHLAWVSRLEAEFFTQGDAERAHGLPISPLCDRTKQGITKSQVGFFDFVALPLFNNFTTRFTAAKPLLSGVMANYRHWQLQAAAAVEAQAAAEGASVCTVGGGTRP